MRVLVAVVVVGMVGMTCVLCLIWYMVSQRKKVRTARLTQVAQQLGIPFFPAGDPLLIGRLASLPLFSVKASKSIVNVLREVRPEVEFGIFDYNYRIGTGENSHSITQSVMYFCSKTIDLPKFTVYPKMQFHKILRVLGIVQQVIDLGTRPQFAEQYGLTGDDEAAVRDLFCDELLEFFEGQKNQINVQGHDHQLLLYRHGQRIAPDQVEQFMVEGFEIFKRFCHSEDA